MLSRNAETVWQPVDAAARVQVIVFQLTWKTSWELWQIYCVRSLVM